MTDKFKPPAETLPPIATLLNSATVTAADVEAAVKEWRNDPPDKAFDGILEATEVEESE